jgi:hypothetical protein
MKPNSVRGSRTGQHGQFAGSAAHWANVQLAPSTDD